MHTQGYDVYALDGTHRSSQGLPAGDLIAALEDDSTRSPDHLQRLVTLNKQLHLGRSPHDNLLIGQMHFPADTRQA